MNKNLFLFSLAYVMVATIPWALGIVQIKENFLLFRLILDSMMLFLLIASGVTIVKNR